MKLVLKIVGGLFLGAALLFGIGFAYFIYVFSGAGERIHETDKALVQQFLDNKTKYINLIKMFRDDHPVTVVHPNFVRPAGAISDVRWNTYKQIFSELQLDAGIRSWGGESIWFISTTQGLVTGGSSKGYMYKPENPNPVYSNLDEIPKDLRSNVNGYKKIDDNWYITFKWDD